MISHQTGLEKIVKKRISLGMDYMEILRSLYGADPREVWEVFLKHSQAFRDYRKIGIKNSSPDFPEPHLAYSQWRMASSSMKKIIGQIGRKEYQQICFLGCPVLGSEFEEVFPGTSYILDIDIAILNKVKKSAARMEYDTNNRLPDEFLNEFDCVVCDPPWYDDDIKLFIQRASQLTKIAGSICFSLPGILTRPSSVNERLGLQKWLSDSGLVIVESSPSVEYEVPPFEYMAYNDIPAFTGEIWRIGDWVKLKKAEDSKQEIKSKNDKEKWAEFLFNGKRIFLRDKERSEGYEPPELFPLYENGSLILNSVSRRNPLISQIDMWTSRNAVLHVNSGIGVVEDILRKINLDNERIVEGIAEKYSLHKESVSSDCREAITRIRQLIEV